MNKKTKIWAMCIATVICVSLLVLTACANDAESYESDGSDDGDDPVVVTVAYDEPESGLPVFEDSESLDLETVKISVNKEVKNFKFISVVMDADTAPVAGDTLYEADKLTPSEPFYARTRINEGWSDRGFSFENAKGETECYRIVFNSLNGDLTAEVIPASAAKTQ